MGLLDRQVPYPGDSVNVRAGQPSGTHAPLALTVTDLRSIADTVERLAGVPGFVDSIRVGQHRITLERHSDQRDGNWYTVVAITRAEVGR